MTISFQCLLNSNLMSDKVTQHQCVFCIHSVFYIKDVITNQGYSIKFMF